MTPTATAIPSELPARAGGLPATFHIAAAVWVAGMLALAALLPLTSEDLLQEDRFVEWWTVALFAAAAWFRLRSAIPARRWFDILVGLFCVFVAGEEFSWGNACSGSRHRLRSSSTTSSRSSRSTISATRSVSRAACSCSRSAATRCSVSPARFPSGDVC